MAPSDPKRELRESVHPKDATDDPGNVTPGELQPTPCISPPPKKGHDSSNGAQDCNFWREKPIETVTLIIVLAYTVISFFQWLALNDSNQINREAVQSVQ